MSFRLKFAAIVFMLVVSTASAQDAKGWYEENCDGATFHFTKISGRSHDQRLELFFRTGSIPFRLYPTGPEWRGVYGKRCPATGKCEDVAIAPNAKMQFQENGNRVVSGKYIIDLNGEHREGRFRVKERFLKHPSRICM